jgi:hypothetical protein
MSPARRAGNLAIRLTEKFGGLARWIDPVSGWASVVRPASRQAVLVRTGYEGGVDGVSSEKQVQ